MKHKSNYFILFKLHLCELLFEKKVYNKSIYLLKVNIIDLTINNLSIRPYPDLI